MRHQMKRSERHTLSLWPWGMGVSLLAVGLVGSAHAQVKVQCPGDTNGDAVIDQVDPNHPHATCTHLTGGDGFARMADGSVRYIFGFSDVTGVAPAEVMSVGTLRANLPAPTLTFKEGDEVYLTLSNVGMVMRPDLFDGHSLHWHGFPNAASTFDGEPEASFGIGMGASLTYYYQVKHPGTYLYHCHVEATEHMQMGMLGNLWVSPRQNGTPYTYRGRTYTKFIYNDGDGSTGYDVEYPLQISSLDPVFHDASWNVQPLPFAEMFDRYGLLNGRGYPDTVSATAPPAPEENGGQPSQPLDSRIVATQGQRILLRVSNVSVTRFFTLTSTGLKLKVVGYNARLLRGPALPTESGPKDISYWTNTVTLGGGEALDILVDTQQVAPGTYFIYTTNLNYLTNDREDYGGIMTELTILPARNGARAQTTSPAGAARISRAQEVSAPALSQPADPATRSPKSTRPSEHALEGGQP